MKSRDQLVKATVNRAGGSIQRVVQPALKPVDNRPQAILQRKLQEAATTWMQSRSQPKAGAVVQRVIHKGKRIYSQPYQKLSPLWGNHNKAVLTDMLNDEDRHYVYDKDTDQFTEVFEPVKKAKRKRSPSNSSDEQEFKGWARTVDEGVVIHNKKQATKVKYRARTLKDAGKGGFNVGINCIAGVEGMETTNDVEMTDTQERLNYFARHTKDSMLFDGYEAESENDTADEKKEKQRNNKKHKQLVGPEIQFLVGTENNNLHVHVGGNSEASQKLLRKKFRGKTLNDYHRTNHRASTINQAAKGIRTYLKNHTDIQAQLFKLMDQGKDDAYIASKIKSLIKSDYKTKPLQHLYKLRNSLKGEYGGKMLGDAKLTIPDNKKEIHAESNLLEATIKKLEILDVMGTKVPCVACFTKFRQEGKADHLLQSTSSIWFSEPCMHQVGFDYQKHTVDEVVGYLKEIHRNMKDIIDDVKQYTGHMGDITPKFDNYDSDSMGEESRDLIISELRQKHKARKKIKTKATSKVTA